MFESNPAINVEFLRKNIVEVNFLVKYYLFQQPRYVIDKVQNSVVRLNKTFYELLLEKEISAEKKESFEEEKNFLIEQLMEGHHESFDIPQMEEYLDMELEIEKRKYFHELNEHLWDEYHQTPEGKMRLELLKPNGKSFLSFEEFEAAEDG